MFTQQAFKNEASKRYLKKSIVYHLLAVAAIVLLALWLVEKAPPAYSITCTDQG
jgi:hypothetical protein